ncbi:hypothetical protein [Paenibacillus sp. sgz500958]|uniref:hypothetical protein n=1 Tax=Paenibacillus sp. sgz500958 TaxID=3242475 RepID=UPI0036D28B32
MIELKKFQTLTLIILMFILSSCSFGQSQEIPDKPYKPEITNNRTELEYIGGSSCWFGTNTEVGECSDPLAPETFYKMIRDQASGSQVEPGSKVKIRFSVKPEKLYIGVLKDDLNQKKVEHNNGSFQVSTESGYYQYVVSADWGGHNTASYHFGVYVK